MKCKLSLRDLSHLPFMKRAERLVPSLADVYEGREDPLLFRHQYYDALIALQDQDLDFKTLGRHIRCYRHGYYACTAIAELYGLEGILQSAQHLSSFADATIDTALKTQSKNLIDRKRLPEQFLDLSSSGLIVLAMGKLGAEELNFSSDVDLIVFYDPYRADLVSEFPDFQRFLIKLVQETTRLLSELTAEGFAYRVDLRLRPDPGATAVVISTDAAEQYYETLGQNWERAAFIRARPAAADVTAGHQFLTRLNPFVWRRSMDAYAVEDVKSIKRQIQAHYHLHDILVEDHDLKLGVGGIREIEFFAQTQQLLAGGRMPSLRARRTKDALLALRDEGFIEALVCKQLIDSYESLRSWEHRVQYVDDRQTHRVPKDADAFQTFCKLAGFTHEDHARAEMLTLFQLVHGHFSDLFSGHHLASSQGSLSFTGPDHDPNTLATLEKLGYQEPDRVMMLVKQWHHGRMGATRTAKARALLTDLTPVIIELCARQDEPDVVLGRFDRFLRGLPSGVQIFSLFNHEPQVLNMLMRIMAAAPKTVSTLIEKPAVLESILDPGFFTIEPTFAVLSERLKGRLDLAQHFDQVLDIVRDFCRDEQFRIQLQILEGCLSSQQAGMFYSILADVVMSSIFPHVEHYIAAQHGQHVAGFAVIALGKYGSMEMTAQSDLDLVFVYGDQDQVLSDDGRKLPGGAYYTKLGQRLIAALSVPTASGELYDVDLRLRPSGNSGPLSTSLSRFSHYHLEESWTWELMALLRARVVYAQHDLQTRIMALIKKAHLHAQKRLNITDDVLQMRKKLWKERHPRGVFDIKYRTGGMIDIEFILQHAVLLSSLDDFHEYGATIPALLDWCEEHACLAQDDLSVIRHAHFILADLEQLSSVVGEKAHEFLLRQPQDMLLAQFLSRHGWQNLCMEEAINRICIPVVDVFVRQIGDYRAED